MAVDKYKGKKVSVVLPLELYEQIEKLATEDVRSVSSMVVKLCQAAIAAQNTTQG